MKIFIDCDGVLLNTEERLMSEYEKLKASYPDLTIGAFIESMDWRSWLHECGPLDDSVDVLKTLPLDKVSILTSVNSIDEGCAKINYFRELGIKNDIIIVPGCAKSLAVNANGNVLIDDYKENLRSWRAADGIPIQFRKNRNNGEFPIIESLAHIPPQYLL